MADRVERVRRSREDVASDLKEFEARFLGMNGALERLYDGSVQVIGKGEELMRLSCGELGAEGMLSRVSESVSPTLSFFGECGERAGKNVSELQSYRGNIEMALRLDRGLEQTIAQLTFVKTLFCVESASLDSQTQVMFSSLVEGMQRLQAQVTESFRKRFKEFETTASTIDELARRLESEAESQRRSMGDGNREILQMLDAIQRMQKENVERERQLGVSAQSISELTTRMVMAMQFQDIVDQKLKHVFETIAEAEAAFHSLEGTGNKRERGRTLRFIEKACEVSSNQVAAARSEIEDALRTLEGGFQGVMDEARLNRKTVEDAFPGAESMVESLLDIFPRIDLMVTESVDSIKTIVERINPINQLTSSFSQLIAEMSCQLHLIGLNAEVQAAKVEQGTGLEVLSAKTSGISLDTQAICQKIAAELDSLALGLKQVYGDFESLLEDGKARQRDLRRQIEREGDEIKGYGERYKDAVGEIGVLWDNFDQIVGPAVKSLSFDLPVLRALERMEYELRELTEESKRLAQRCAAEEADESMLEQVYSRYTMVSERDVHEASVTQRKSGAGLRAEADLFSDERQEGSVELF